jgi:hypothetical protein
MLVFRSTNNGDAPYWYHGIWCRHINLLRMTAISPRSSKIDHTQCTFENNIKLMIITHDILLARNTYLNINVLATCVIKNIASSLIHGRKEKRNNIFQITNSLDRWSISSKRLNHIVHVSKTSQSRSRNPSYWWAFMHESHSNGDWTCTLQPAVRYHWPAF